MVEVGKSGIQYIVTRNKIIEYYYFFFLHVGKNANFYYNSAFNSNFYTIQPYTYYNILYIIQ